MSTNIKTGIIAAIVALIVAGGTWLALPAKTPAVGVATSFGNTSIDGSQTILPNPSNFDYLVARLGLGLGTNTSNSNTGVGNVIIEAQRQVLTSGTTTPCVIANPTGATSTIISWSMNITNPTTTVMTWALGTTTANAFATSSSMATLLESGNGTTNSTTTLSWDPGINNAVIGPGQIITIGAGAGTSPTSGANTAIVIGGSCQAVFMTAN